MYGNVLIFVHSYIPTAGGAEMAKFSGGKMSGSHTTAIPAADSIVREALKRPEVSKIVLGLIKAGKCGGAPRAKFDDIDSGLKCTVRGSTGI